MHPTASPSARQRRHAEAGAALASEEHGDESKAARPRTWRQALGRRLLAAGACAFCLKLALTAWLMRFASSRCFLIDWHARLRIYSVPVVQGQQQLDASIRRHEPALLLDALKGWPAVGKWSPEWFGHELADEVAEVYFWGRSGADWRKTRVFEVTLAQYARLLRAHRAAAAAGRDAGPAPYLQEDEWLFGENLERLLPDVEHLPYRPHLAPARAGGVHTETALWMGPPGSRTGIHWDSVNALLHQLQGSKRVTLWPPSARDALYPSPKYNHGAGLSLVDAAAPNHTAFPRFAAAPSVTVMLTAGSALFVPAGWWHAVHSLDESVSLAYRSQTPCQARAALPDDALRWLHERGWYKRGNCVCHPDACSSGKCGADDGLDEAVDRALREAGAGAAAKRPAPRYPSLSAWALPRGGAAPPPAGAAAGR